MAAQTTPSSMELTKKVYGDQLERIEFHDTYFTELAKFTSKGQVGDTFQWWQELAMEHGATYLPSSGAAANLAAAIVGEAKQASLSPYEFHMRTQITTKAFESAMAGGAEAFENLTRNRMDALMRSAELRKEHTYMYGQQGLFKVSSIDTGVITVTAETWCPALAARLAPGAVLEAWSTQAASATQHDTDLTVTVTDLDAKTITVSGTSSSVAANDWLYFKGARTNSAHLEPAGIRSIMSTTTGTNAFGLSMTTYSWIKPNVSSSFGRPTMLLVLQAMRKLVARSSISTKGRTSKTPVNENTTLWIASPTYEILNSDLMGGRVFDASYQRGKGTSGVQTIEYYGQTGITTLMVHPLCRDGDGFAIGADNAFRIGSSELKWKRGPQGETDLWANIQGTNYYEAGVCAIDAPALRAPGRTVMLTGITE